MIASALHLHSVQCSHSVHIVFTIHIVFTYRRLVFLQTAAQRNCMYFPSFKMQQLWHETTSFDSEKVPSSYDLTQGKKSIWPSRPGPLRVEKSGGSIRVTENK